MYSICLTYLISNRSEVEADIEVYNQV